MSEGDGVGARARAKPVPAPTVASVLAAVGGFVDAVGFIVLFGLFTAHQSGNTTGLGVALPAGDWRTVLQRGFVIPVFVVATAAGVAWFDAHLRRDGASRDAVMAGLLWIEAGVLAVLLVAARVVPHFDDFAVDSPGYLLVGALAATAMGVQNATLRRVDGITVHTTFVTGMLTEAAVGFVQWRHLATVVRSPGADAADHDGLVHARHEARLAAAVWCAYLAGGVTGAFLVVHLDAGVLVLPIAVVVGLGLLLRRTGS